MLLNATIRRARRQGRSEAQIMVVAWNEWTEQAVLEPSDRYGLGYLEALRKSLKNWGQYHYEGPADLWRQGPRIPQLTRCGHCALEGLVTAGGELGIEVRVDTNHASRFKAPLLVTTVTVTVRSTVRSTFRKRCGSGAARHRT